MEYKYAVLKSSWGVVIWLDIAELVNPLIEESDIHLGDTVYLRFSAPIRLTESEEYWLNRGFFSLANLVAEKREQALICFDIQALHFNPCDYQEEGLYCAAREWIAKYYDLAIEPIEVHYDGVRRKYIFKID